MAPMNKNLATLIEQLLARLEGCWGAERAAVRFSSAFQDWRDRFPALEPFEDVDDLVPWFRDTHVTYEKKDPVARALCLLAQERNPAASALLIYLFLPAFERSLWMWGDDLIAPDELLAEMLAGFAEAIQSFTPKITKTCGHLIGKARSAARSFRRDEPRRNFKLVDGKWVRHNFSLEEIAEKAIEVLGIADDPAEADDPDRTEFDVLDDAVNQEVITEREADLVKARLRGKDLQETAGSLGLTYKAAAEMRRRAEGRLAAWLMFRELPSRRNVPRRAEIRSLPALSTSQTENLTRRKREAG